LEHQSLGALTSLKFTFWLPYIFALHPSATPLIPVLQTDINIAVLPIQQDGLKIKQLMQCDK